MKSDKILWILEDDPGAIFVYRELLDLRYQLQFFNTIASLKTALESNAQRPHLFIADMRLPDGTFIDFLAEAKNRDILDLPFIIVSSVDDIDVLRESFAEGALDYLTKPFNKVQLMAKVERFLSQAPYSNLKVEGFKMKVSTDKANVSLTPKELQILEALKQNPGQPKTRADIIKKVWGDVSVTNKALDVHIYNLRRKLLCLNIDVEFVYPDSFRLQQNG
jgi:DNA-binding response OmpR family regulator